MFGVLVEEPVRVSLGERRTVNSMNVLCSRCSATSCQRQNTRVDKFYYCTHIRTFFDSFHVSSLHMIVHLMCLSFYVIRVVFNLSSNFRHDCNAADRRVHRVTALAIAVQSRFVGVADLRHTCSPPPSISPARISKIARRTSREWMHEHTHTRARVIHSHRTIPPPSIADAGPAEAVGCFVGETSLTLTRLALHYRAPYTPN